MNSAWVNVLRFPPLTADTGTSPSIGIYFTATWLGGNKRWKFNEMKWNLMKWFYHIKVMLDVQNDLINLIKHILGSFLDFPGLMSCPDTAAPTPEWSRTSASSVRRSLPAVITCRNTSKSTAFHEAAERVALQTDFSDSTLTDWC